MNDKKELKLILVAARNQLSSNDIKSLIAYLESDDCEFEISLQISEPTEQPELLELHRLVAIPALIKISPAPKQIFAGSNIFAQLHSYLIEGNIQQEKISLLCHFCLDHLFELNALFAKIFPPNNKMIR